MAHQDAWPRAIFRWVSSWVPTFSTLAIPLSLQCVRCSGWVPPRHQGRRHGVLVITHHQARQWRDTETNELMNFSALIQRLDAIAVTLVHNSAGAIQVRCLGINSSDPQ